jgi:glycosyltransferase involved in cell wall biosynthesis
MKKIAIITTHVIQYQVPLFKILQDKNIKADIFFASKHGLRSIHKDHEFKIKFNWDAGKDYLKGYQSYFPKKQKSKINDFKLSFEGIEKIIKKNSYDALILLGWSNLHYLNAFWIAKKNNIKIILRAENNLEQKTFFIKAYIKFFILKFFFKHIDFFLSIGKLNNKFYVHHKVKKKKILKAPYFVDNAFFDKKKNTGFKKKSEYDKKKLILFVGKLINRKRPLDFLKLAKLNSTDQSLHFIMIGDGNLKKKCKEFIKNKKMKNVTLVGFINQKELSQYYSIGDLFVMTSDYETWGLTINEAMAANIPVICSNKCGAHHDLIKNNKTGYTYVCGDISDLNKKLKLLINNKKLLTKMKHNTKKIISRFTAKKTAEAIKIILNDKKI